jgi:hypothetical protein
MRLALLLSALGGCWRFATPAAAGPGFPLWTGRSGPVERRLDEVAQQLDRAAGADDTSGLRALPDWVRPQPCRLGSPPEPADADRLRAAMADGPPRRRALAMLWRATASDPADVAAFEANLDDASPAGTFPSVTVTQQVMPAYPVTWRRLTVGEVAAASLGCVFGQSFQGPDDYRRWRADHPDPAQSPEVWDDRLRAGPRADAPETLKSLEPRLALRVRLLDPSRWGWSDEQMRAAWRRHVGPEATADLLLGRTRWAEHASPERFGAFAVWALPEADRATLEALWARDQDEALPRWTRPALAVALARAAPERETELLVAAVAEGPAEHLGPVLEALVASDLAAHRDLLADWLARPPGGPAAVGQAALLRAVGALGRPARDHLAALVADPRFDPRDATVVGALIDAVRGTGPEIALPCAEGVPDPVPKLWKGPPTPQQRREREEAAAAAAAARVDCVARIRDALAR